MKSAMPPSLSSMRSHSGPTISGLTVRRRGPRTVPCTRLVLSGLPAGRSHGKAEVVAEIGRRISPAAVDGEGRLRRDVLRELVFEEPEKRRDLEGLLHPLVRKECLEFKAQTSRQGVSPLFVADVPLLFEGGIDYGQEMSLLVATTRGTQLARLKSRNGFDDEMAEAILGAQWPIEDKLAPADVVFWNEGPESVLRRQLLRFLPTLDP